MTSVRAAVLAALAAATLCSAGISQAAERSWHAHAGLGGGRPFAISKDANLTPFGEQGETDSSSTRDVVAGVAFGDKLRWGVELEHSDLGTSTWSSPFILVADQFTEVSLDADVRSLGGTFALHDGSWEFLAKLGWFDLEGTVATAGGVAGGGTSDVSDDGMLVELGLRRYLGRHVAIRLGMRGLDFEQDFSLAGRLLLEVHY